MNIKSKISYSQLTMYLCLLLIAVSANTLTARVNPEHLENRIQKQLSDYYLDNYMDSYRISIDRNRMVTINGESRTLFDKLKIGEIINSVDGVNGINNKIVVQTDQTPNDLIKANIEYELQRNNTILEPEKIKVNVKEGVVNLSGTVSYVREKIIAQSIASWQDGVTDMRSDVKVLSPVAATSDENLSVIISDILKRFYPLETNVNFKLKDGDVVLRGTARSNFAKLHLQRDIQKITGVRYLVNNISVANNYF